MQASIKHFIRLGQEGVAVHAQVSGPLEANAVMASLSQAARGKFRVLPESVVVTDTGRVVNSIRAIMVPTINVIPAPENMNGFTALSNNMYVDSHDSMWGLRETPAGRFLVMADEASNIDQLMDMMASCSSSVEDLRAGSPAVAKSIAEHELRLTGVEQGDVVSYYSSLSNTLRVGAVVDASTAEFTQHVTVAPLDGTESEAISTSAVAVYVDHREIDYPQDVSLSAVGSPDVERLVDYYRRMFSYAPEYFRMLESRIRSHAFC
jgi:hypothetical protein